MFGIEKYRMMKEMLMMIVIAILVKESNGKNINDGNKLIALHPCGAGDRLRNNLNVTIIEKDANKTYYYTGLLISGADITLGYTEILGKYSKLNVTREVENGKVEIYVVDRKLNRYVVKNIKCFKDISCIMEYSCECKKEMGYVHYLSMIRNPEYSNEYKENPGYILGEESILEVIDPINKTHRCWNDGTCQPNYDYVKGYGQIRSIVQDIVKYDEKTVTYEIDTIRYPNNQKYYKKSTMFTVHAAFTKNDGDRGTCYFLGGYVKEINGNQTTFNIILDKSDKERGEWSKWMMENVSSGYKYNWNGIVILLISGIGVILNL